MVQVMMEYQSILSSFLITFSIICLSLPLMNLVFYRVPTSILIFYDKFKTIIWIFMVIQFIVEFIFLKWMLVIENIELVKKLGIFCNCLFLGSLYVLICVAYSKWLIKNGINSKIFNKSKNYAILLSSAIVISFLTLPLNLFVHINQNFYSMRSISYVFLFFELLVSSLCVSALYGFIGYIRAKATPQ